MTLGGFITWLGTNCTVNVNCHRRRSNIPFGINWISGLLQYRPPDIRWVSNFITAEYPPARFFEKSVQIRSLPDIHWDSNTYNWIEWSRGFGISALVNFLINIFARLEVIQCLVEKVIFKELTYISPITFMILFTKLIIVQWHIIIRINHSIFNNQDHRLLLQFFSPSFSFSRTT